VRGTFRQVWDGGFRNDIFKQAFEAAKQLHRVARSASHVWRGNCQGAPMKTTWEREESAYRAAVAFVEAAVRISQFTYFGMTVDFTDNPATTGEVCQAVWELKGGKLDA